MKNNEKFILMYKDFAVLSFKVDFKNSEVKNIEKLKDFKKAPYSLLKFHGDLEIALQGFINRRAIPKTRTDYQEIIKATGFKTGFELSFQGHGLSLSDHFWYQRENENLAYEDINFFTNRWDDSFGRAVIRQDYEALKHCDLNVPDVVTNGWGIKGWVYEENGPKLYKLGINQGHDEEAIGEVLASKIARRLFNENEVLKYELKKVDKQYASVSPLIASFDEDMIPLADYLDAQTRILYRRAKDNKELINEFLNRVKKTDIPNLSTFFMKLMCLKDLCFISDLHFGNISLIKNEKTGQIRIAPIYDLGAAFGSTRNGQNIISSPNKTTYLLVYYAYSNIDPSWDYSWYDKDKLLGVEKLIKEYLSKSNFYTPPLIDQIIEVYQHQKAALDKMAQK